MSTKQYVLITLLLLTACIGTFALLTILENSTMPLTKGHRPDSYMTDAVATRINTDGELNDELIAPLLVHFPENDTTRLNAPHFIIFNVKANEPPWHITARHGQANAGITSLQLWDQVKLVQAAGSEPPTILSTAALTILPQQQYVQTAQKVQAWQPNVLITAIGLNADLKSGTINLLSQVYAKLQPATVTQTVNS